MSKQTELDQAVEELKKHQTKVFEEMEPEVQAQLKKTLGVSELTEQFEKANTEMAEKIEAVQTKAAEVAEEKANKVKEEYAEKMATLTGRLDEAEKLFSDVSEKKDDPYRISEKILASAGFKHAVERKDDRTGKMQVGFFPVKALRRTFGGEVMGMEDLEEGVQKMVSGAANSGNALVDSRRIQGVILEPDISLNVQDLIPTTIISERDVDWVRENVLTNAAATVAESATGSLVAKPESDITYELVEKTMRTIATWIAASRQILQDSRRTQLRSMIDRRLNYMVNLELEDQVLLGDGQGQNLEGLVPHATDYNQGYDEIQGAAATKLDTLRRAKTQAREAEYPVTGIVLNPQDWEDIELLKGSDLHYIFAQPALVTTPRIWGVPIADSTRMTEGEFLVGAFSLGAELFTMGDATVEISRSHASFFIQNTVAILAEMRALLAIYRPQAFVTGPFAAGSGSGS